MGTLLKQKQFMGIIPWRGKSLLPWVFFGLMLSCSQAAAETLVFSSGGTLTGKMVEKTEDHVKLAVQGAVLTYKADEIESIDGVKYDLFQNTDDSPRDVARYPVYSLGQLSTATAEAAKSNKPVVFYIADEAPAGGTDQAVYVYVQPGAIDSLPVVVRDALTAKGKVKIPFMVTVNAQVTEVAGINEVEKPVFDIPVGDSYVYGKKDAPATIVMFSDFQCPYCAEALPKVKSLVDENPERARFVYKHFPLQGHPMARPAARAALAAGKQGKYYEMVELLLENYSRLDNGIFQDLAEEIGLDVEQFRNDLYRNAGDLDRMIDADLQLGERLGVRGTPAFFVNGRESFSGELKELIDAVRIAKP